MRIQLLWLFLLLPSSVTSAENESLKQFSKSYTKFLSRVTSKQSIQWEKIRNKEKQLFLETLQAMQRVNLEQPIDPNDQLAFWINAHNLCVFKFISEHMPVENVMKIKGFRDELRCIVGHSSYSLVEIASSKIPSVSKNSRAHFALWWGTRGGPPLATVPYQGSTIQEKLKEKTKNIVNDPRYVRIETKPSLHIEASPFFDWYKYDLEKKGDVLKFIKQNLSSENLQKISTFKQEIVFTAFDWSLDQ